MKPHAISICFATTLSLVGCQSATDYVQKNPDRVGAPAVLGVVGAASGYTLGGAAGAAGLGVAGLGVGLLTSGYLAKRDSRIMDPVFERVLAGPTGKPMNWKNPHTGNAGTLTAMSPVVDFFDGKCRWIRSDQRPAKSPNPVINIQIDYSAMFAREDLMLCDRGEGWYITWDDHVSRRLQQAAAQTATRNTAKKNNP
ncbi:MAG TPA: hypothetical protein DCS82_04530 [Rhodospirillaceae bacterium]|nr:hypothetical protein [Rhodospirillaceae bacterium]HAA91942.1 hypothetical protein [Rhodospirillaceae bacterium]HAT34960.1 hypothetical protein [Rhodospirillaceae bacterium]